MDIVFQCVEGGRALYAVRAHGRDLFVGTKSECARYLAIRQRKVLDERAGEQRPFRMRPYTPRTYRVSRKLHA